MSDLDPQKKSEGCVRKKASFVSQQPGTRPPRGEGVGEGVVDVQNLTNIITKLVAITETD